MTHPTDPTDPSRTTEPSRSPATSLRFGRWALFILAVAAAAVVARQASERHDGDLFEGDAAAPSDGAAGAARIPSAPLTAAATGSAAAGGGLDRSYSIDSGGEFQLDVGAGDVSVTRAAGAQVRIVVELEPDAAPDKVRITEQQVRPDLVHLTVEPTEKEGGGLSFFGGHVRLGGSFQTHMKIRQVRVEVPAGVRVAVATGAGDVAVSDIASEVKVESGAGDIAVRRAGGVEASTGAGDVSLSEISGNVHVQAGAGDVAISGAAAAVDVETGAGGITVRGASAALDLESGMGSIEVRIPSVLAPIQADTGMGSIEVTIEAGGFDLNAASGMGSVEITTNGGSERSHGMGGEMRRAVGGGGPSVRLESGAGSIAVHAPASGASRTAL